MKWLALVPLCLPISVHAQDRFCPNRPDLATSTCTTEPGRVLIEASGVDWELDDTADARTDTIRIADLLIRTGIGPNTEVQLSWTPYGQIRTRDKASGLVNTTRGVGDMRLGLRHNILGNNADALSIALEPFATLPVGTGGLSDGDWGAGVLLPVSYPLAADWTLGFTGEVAASADDDGDGRHLAYAGVVGLGRSLTEQVTAVAEIALRREDDPLASRTEALGAFSVAWQPRDRLQVDALLAAGLNHTTPDLRIQIGGAILF